MNPTALAPLTHALPELFRRRAGPAAQVLFEAIDAEWLASASPWPALGPPDLDRLDALARATGWGRLLEEVGGIAQVARPALLGRLIGPDSWGTDELCRFWSECLFGLSLNTIAVDRPSAPSLPPRVRMVLAGDRLPDAGTVFRAMARLVPAHFIFTPRDLLFHIHSQAPGPLGPARLTG